MMQDYKKEQIIEIIEPFVRFAEERLKNRIAGNRQVVYEFNGKKLLFQDLVNIIKLFNALNG